jgi:hypothetical protein
VVGLGVATRLSLLDHVTSEELHTFLHVGKEISERYIGIKEVVAEGLVLILMAVGELSLCEFVRRIIRGKSPSLHTFSEDPLLNRSYSLLSAPIASQTSLPTLTSSQGMYLFIFFTYIYPYIHISFFIHMCICMYLYIYKRTYIFLYIYIYIYIYSRGSGSGPGRESPLP